MPTDPVPTTAVPLSLAGRTALITGGSRGIGASTVRLFHQAGARVVFSYRTEIDRAEALAAELNEPGRPATCIPLQQDLRTPEDGRTLVAAAIGTLGTPTEPGHLDILIVNHGIWPSHDQPIQTMSDTQWTTTLDTNLASVFGLVQAATAAMLARPWPPSDPSLQQPDRFAPIPPRGHIVLVASTAAQRGEAFHADYAASKGALIALTKSLSSELAPQGILANCVAPGWVETEMSAPALRDPALAGPALALIPLARPGHVAEIAGPILFLCTPLAGFISGEILNVNGGAVLVG